MHRCLRVPELLLLIFSFLEEDSSRGPYISRLQRVFGDNTEGHHSLAALARTCKYFFDPALDVLWRRQCPAFLVSVLPQCELSSDGHIQRVKLLDKHISGTDFDRLTTYSRRIKLFDLAVGPSLNAAIYTSLFRIQRKRSEPLLPHVRSLRLPEVPKNQWQRKLVPLLFGRTLKSITEPWIDDQILLKAISNPDCSLRVIHSMYLPTDPLAVANLITLVNNCRSLEEVDFRRGKFYDGRSAMDIGLWHAFAQLPSLRCFSARLPDNTGMFTLSDGFVALQEIIIEALQFDFMQFVGPSCHCATNISHLTLKIGSEDVLSLLPLIRASFGGISALRVLNRERLKQLETDGESPPVSRWRTTQPFTMLEEIWITGSSQIEFQDDDLTALSKICPQATVLMLGGFKMPPLVTHLGVSSILQNCARLHVLGVEWDTSTINEGVLDGSVRNETFAYLCCDGGRSTLFDPSLVAAYLSHVAPNIQEVLDISGDSDEDFTPWKAVQDALDRRRRDQGKA